MSKTAESHLTPCTISHQEYPGQGAGPGPGPGCGGGAGAGPDVQVPERQASMHFAGAESQTRGAEPGQQQCVASWRLLSPGAVDVFAHLSPALHWHGSAV
mmetsp:Transcript_60262/g.187019  ORF Transcript_60262/g.187019 Transcript_60262/m.187019 type:complete len:100 (-) Transcript_60262:7-306(-)